jgi:hypothetical protein
VPATHVAARRGIISLAELARMRVIHGPRRTEVATYDAWTQVLREVNPRFEFTDPPLQHSLSVALAFAAACDQPAAVLSGPAELAKPAVPLAPARAGARGTAGAGSARGGDMVRVYLEGQPLTAVAALVWNGDLPAKLQQILFDTADGIADILSPARPLPAAV